MTGETNGGNGGNGGNGPLGHGGLGRSDFAVVMPPEIAREIITGTRLTSVAMALGTRRNMSTKELTIPVLDTFPTVYWLSGEGDTAKKPTAGISLTGVNIIAEELGVIVRVPEQVLDDLTFDLWAEVRPLLSEAVGLAIDNAVFYGAGNPSVPATFPAGGLLQACADHSKTLAMGTEVDVGGDLSELMVLVESDGYDPTGFAMAPQMRGILRNMRDEGGGLIFTPTMQQDAPALTWGLPSYQLRGINAWTQSPAFTGEWRNLIIAVRQDIRYRISTDAVVEGVSLYETDQVALRMTFRMGWTAVIPPNLDNPDPATRFPFAALLPGTTRRASAQRPATRTTPPSEPATPAGRARAAERREG